MLVIDSVASGRRPRRAGSARAGKSVLITGATGALGSAAARALCGGPGRCLTLAVR